MIAYTNSPYKHVISLYHIERVYAIMGHMLMGHMLILIVHILILMSILRDNISIRYHITLQNQCFNTCI